MKFSFVLQTFFNKFIFQDKDQDQDSTMKLNDKKLCYILKIPTKFNVVPQNFCHQSTDQDQYQDQDHNFSLHFNTRTTFYT